MVDHADLVGVWEVPLQDGVHRVEFEHGTTSGKRVIRVDGKVNISCIISSRITPCIVAAKDKPSCIGYVCPFIMF